MAANAHLHATPASPHSLRFAYSTINWGATCDIAAALDDIRSEGWGAVEFFGHTLDLMGTPSSLMAQMGDLVPATLFGGIELPISDLHRTIHKNHIRFASEIGASAYGLVGGGRLRFRPPSAQEYAELAAFCEDLAVFGNSGGVTVSYHPHALCTIETSAEIELLMAQTSELKLCLDASHIALVGEDPLTVIDRWWDRISYIHLKDWGNGKFAELGRGTLGIDFSAILRMLAERAFRGWVVLEQSQSEISPRESARINAEFLRGLGYEVGNR
ncbi:MAG: sugar phosphate isomerase/epimerase family protein [Thermomicrobiales bacterium]